MGDEIGSVSVDAGRDQFEVEGVRVSATLMSKMRVKLTINGDNYSTTAWISRTEWDDLVRAME